MSTQIFSELTNKEEIEKNFSFHGNFYMLNGEKHRNVLVIKRKVIGETTESHDFWFCEFDAVFIMMNPGGSKPIDNSIKNKDSIIGLNSLVRTKPDETQYQVCRIAEMKPEWKTILVLNTSDYAETKSNEYFNKLDNEKLDKNHSLFKYERLNSELFRIFSKVKKKAPICLAWGCRDSIEFTRLKKSVIEAVKTHLPKNNLHGLEHEKEKGQLRFKHPYCYSRNSSINWLNDFLAAIETNLKL